MMLESERVGDPLAACVSRGLECKDSDLRHAISTMPWMHDSQTCIDDSVSCAQESLCLGVPWMWRQKRMTP
jgi:hypothetical protein